MRVRPILNLVLAALLLTGLAGCHSMSRGERGALVGAGIGTAIGGAVDDEDPARGAVVGAALGALGGYAVAESSGHYENGYRHRRYDDRHHRRSDYSRRYRHPRRDRCDW